MNDDDGPEPAVRAVPFGIGDLQEQLEAFAARWPHARACSGGRSFVVPGAVARLWIPLAAARLGPDEAIGDYARRADTAIGRQVLLLLRAGAVAIGYWDGDLLVAHKAIRKYVVRGHGRAQPTHLKTRGKSRYGARLRLQNWHRLLVETNERLGEWWRDLGAPERVFHSAPVRSWPELLAVDPPPPFARDAALLHRLPLHVHRPDHEELLRVRGWLVHGRLDLPESRD